MWRNSCLESSLLESEGDTEDGEDTDGREKDTHPHTHSHKVPFRRTTTEPTVKLILDGRRRDESP